MRYSNYQHKKLYEREYGVKTWYDNIEEKKLGRLHEI